jgi:hypothetical protein
MTTVNPTIIKTGGISNTPLKLFQPMNIIVFLSFFSPIILATGITSLSFIFQNFKGLIYLGFLIASCLLRELGYYWSQATPTKEDGTICTSIQYSVYGNHTFSAFVFSFTIMYLSFPMFSYGATNLPVFISLVSYFLIDMFIKLYKKCIIKTSELFFNILFGALIALSFVFAMTAGNSDKFLFFNEVSSNKDICYQPKKQTFKCSLYKNGELISGIP